MRKLALIIAALLCIHLSAQTQFSPSMTGFSTNPTADCAYYVTDTANNITTCVVSMSGTGGVSNKTTTTVNLPFPAAFSQKTVIATINNGVVNYGRLITRANSNTADLTTGSGGLTGWSAAGTKSFNFGIQYASKPVAHRLIFDGNSLTTHNASSGVSYRVRDSLIYDGIYTTMQNYAISGKTTTALLSDFGTKMKPYIGAGDYVILWEITNDISIGKTATQAYNNILSYCDSVHATGAKIFVCTGIPRNDNPAYWPKIDSVNVMLRNSAAGYDWLIDMNTSPAFDQQSDANNTTYFNADKIHLTAAGEQLAAAIMYTKIKTQL